MKLERAVEGGGGGESVSMHRRPERFLVHPVGRSRCHVRVSAFNRRIRTISGATLADKLLKRSGADNFKLVPKHLSRSRLMRPAGDR